MERKYPDLWQGGPWEQPSRPVVYPPSVSRPVLRIKKKKRRSPQLAGARRFSEVNP